MTKEELQKILDAHTLWLAGNTEGQRANLSNADLSGAYLSGAYLSNANLSNADLSGANLRDAYLIEANLSGADLSGADLSGAYLRSANLSGANLRDANLIGANLIGANLTNTCVLTFTLGAHFGFAHFGDQYKDGSYVKIGCEGHSLEHWLENYEEIGKKHGYTDKQIQRYGIQLKALQEMSK